MLIDGVCISAPKIVPQKPLIEIVQELCKETKPKPIFCEIPEDLKLKTPDNSGTQTVTFATSINSVASGYGTSTTTTL